MLPGRQLCSFKDSGILSDVHGTDQDGSRHDDLNMVRPSAASSVTASELSLMHFGSEVLVAVLARYYLTAVLHRDLMRSNSPAMRALRCTCSIRHLRFSLFFANRPRAVSAFVRFGSAAGQPKPPVLSHSPKRCQCAQQPWGTCLMSVRRTSAYRIKRSWLATVGDSCSLDIQSSA